MSNFLKMHNSELQVDVTSFARQANGSAWIQYKNNVILATVAFSDKPLKDVLDFLPLTVEVRERFASVGKIPGGYIKREGRLSDTEILMSRLVDRSLRPLFPSFFTKEVQVMVTLLSCDGSFPREVLSVLASSIALLRTGAEISSPVGAVMCAREKDGAWKVNPSNDFIIKSQDQVLVVGTESGICMMEADCNFIKDNDLVDLIDGEISAEIKNQIEWQKSIIAQVGAGVVNLETSAALEALSNDVLKELLPSDLENYCFAENKSELSQKMTALKNLVVDGALKKFEHENALEKAEVECVVAAFLKKHLPSVVIAAGKRFDNRAFDQIREITSVVDLLPEAHGSSVFTRGQTQALSSVTLGATSDAQRVETLLQGMQDKNFMLHYNFPPFSTGEVKPLRGVGRREIGHGYLCEKSFKQVLPELSSFPYTIRSLVDVLESNGSSSMATVCATMLSLLDAGVPVKKIISGIAMGLMRGSDGKYQIVSDITGTEDGYGSMDFKIIGDEEGVCAIQVDVKGTLGLTKEILTKALAQARDGRVHILKKMKQCIAQPRETLKDSAPRFSTVRIPSSKIGMVIGPSGKNIKQITAETGTQIEIADEGIVTIFANNGYSAKKAEAWIRAIVGDIKPGASYQGKVSKVISDLGIFVSIVPGKDGLIHISQIDRKFREGLEANLKPGSPLDVVVLSVDGDRVKLVAPSLESSEDSAAD